MSVEQILRELTQFNELIQIAEETVRNGRFAGELLCAETRDAPDDPRLQTLLQYQREKELTYLLEYRRLVELRFFCRRALCSLSDIECGILLDRIGRGRSWAEIAVCYSYSETQAKRIYRRARETFQTDYLAYGGELDRVS